MVQPVIESLGNIQEYCRTDFLVFYWLFYYVSNSMDQIYRGVLIPETKLMIRNEIYFLDYDF
jgi:hypothetical protein